MRWFFRILAFLVVVIVVVAGAGYVWLATSLPKTDGVLQLQGLKAEVIVARDTLGIPRIVAQSSDDAYFALGFVHAQDRLWQMEVQRRVGAGRLAELFGADALPADRFMRTLGLYHLAEDSFPKLRPEVRRVLESYAAGVNAYITTHSGALPPEFVLLRHQPEPWKPADSLVWLRLMGLQLSYNWRDELRRANAAKILPPDQVKDLWPTYSPDLPVTLSQAGDGSASPRAASAARAESPSLALAETFERLYEAIPPVARSRLASNEWVVAGAHTASGKPILANDPHLDFQAPILWYLASVVAPDLEVTGATVPGLPLTVLGHNHRIAWGFTTTGTDTMDLFIEKAEGDKYETPDGPKPFVERDEVIKVKDAPTVTLKVRETRHGPIVTDILGDKAGDQLLALSAAFLQPDDVTFQGLYGVNRAGNWDEFLAAARDVGSPQQNAAYADVDGHIGLVAPARVPIRKSGDGTVPEPGWTGDYDWIGWIPFDELPKTFDPPSGLIVNANNKLVPDSYPHFLNVTWPEDGYRAQRIVDLLKGKSRLTPQDMTKIQMDEMDLAALDLKPLLLKTPPVSPQATAAHNLLESWDGVAALDRPEALIFNAWIGHLQHDLLEAWLGPLAKEFEAPRPHFLKAVLQGRTVWCAPKGKPAPPNCDAVVAQALEETVSDLSKAYGNNLSAWHWGVAHPSEFNAILFSHVPVLDRLTQITAPAGGDDFTLHRGEYTTSDLVSFPNIQGGGLRAVYDLANLGASRFIIATGQSGNPLSEHWSDLFNPWRLGNTVTLDAGRSRPDVLTLAPSQ